MNFVSHAELKKLKAALDLILRWNPDFKPVTDDGRAAIYCELEKMGLLRDFLQSYKEKHET